MNRKVLVWGICLLIALTPALAAAEGCRDASWFSSSYWSQVVHQENSLAASVLLVPYLLFSIPIRMADGILNPKPTSQSTIPPAAHRSAH